MAIFEGASQYGSLHWNAKMWLSPELIDPDIGGGQDEDPHSLFASDIYAFGCVIIEVGNIIPT